MSETQTERRDIVIERDFAHPPGRIWRALTQPHLMAEWLMQTDFQPILGQTFSFRAEWGALTCQVTELEPERRLAYTWEPFAHVSYARPEPEPCAGVQAGRAGG